MAYVPGCRYDLFISYAGDNNRDGWVTQFEKALGHELNELIGGKFNPKESIFFDRRKLQVGQSFPDELADAARGSAILVPVLSPGFLTSSWCDRERTEFFAQLPQGASQESCLAPILIRPVEDSELIPLFSNAQRVSFLSDDRQTPVAAGSPEWTARVHQFAAQIRDALQKLRRGCKPVYVGKLAGTAPSQRLRDWCCAELEKRHFRTVPESLLAFDNVDTVTTHLKDAGLAVHFLGGADEAALEAIQTSSDVCAGPTILYQPFGEGLTNDEELWLRAFERQLPGSSRRYQRLHGKHEQELMALIDELLTRPADVVAQPAMPPQLALVCEESDLDGVRHIKDEILARRPIDIDFPSFLASRMKAMERLRKWREFLMRSRRLVFYYGQEERANLEPIWTKAAQENAAAAREWLVGPPDLELKRQKHPDALWNIDQVIALTQQP